VIGTVLLIPHSDFGKHTKVKKNKNAKKIKKRTKNKNQKRKRFFQNKKA